MNRVKIGGNEIKTSPSMEGLVKARNSWSEITNNPLSRLRENMRRRESPRVHLTGHLALFSNVLHLFVVCIFKGKGFMKGKYVVWIQEADCTGRSSSLVRRRPHAAKITGSNPVRPTSKPSILRQLDPRLNKPNWNWQIACHQLHVEHK